jgi:imidazolonepropionase
MLDEGLALALASGYTGGATGTYNPQYLLHLACRELGMSIEEAITATTWNAACSLRMSTVAGSIDPGKQADLNIIDVADYRDLAERPGHNDVLMVLRAGRPIYRRAGLLAFGPSGQ